LTGNPLLCYRTPLANTGEHATP